MESVCTQLVCASRPCDVRGAGVDRDGLVVGLSAAKFLETLERLWIWEWVPGRKRYEDLLLKMIMASQGKEIEGVCVSGE